MKTLEYYTVENTGWSGGISWFLVGGEMTPLRFKTEASATAYALEEKEELDDPDTLWRVVHTTVDRSENREVTIREWVLI